MTLAEPQPSLPDPTSDVLAALAGLLADRGVELRVTPSGELQLRDRGRCLSPADRSTVRYYAEPLADWLTTLNGPEEPRNPHLEKGGMPADPAAPSCDRCGSTGFRDVPIHAGESIRRDCARCGRLIGFPVWYGEPTKGKGGVDF